MIQRRATLDDLYQVQPPPAARKIREMVYSAFMVEDHALHFFFLGGPDFVAGPDAPRARRNILGVLENVGLETGREVIALRRELRELMGLAAGKAIHPVFGLSGGVSRALTEEDRGRFAAAARHAVSFAAFCLELFDDLVLKNSEYLDWITSDAYTHRTYYMGLVDEQSHVAFYDGDIRVVDPEGREHLRFPARRYLDHIAEHTEPWSCVKFCYLRDVGWRGFEEGAQSGIYCVAPLARLNAAEGMSTPMAQAAYERFFAALGGRPVHHTLACHWARLIELLHAAERLEELAEDPELADPHVREIPTATPREGVGVVEAPRGTLLHHYETDERGVITRANLIVATQNNAARIAMSVDKAARHLVRGGQVDDGLLNRIEMAFRAYDPCHGCATHSLPGQMPLVVRILEPDGRVARELRRDG